MEAVKEIVEEKAVPVEEEVTVEEKCEQVLSKEVDHLNENKNSASEYESLGSAESLSENKEKNSEDEEAYESDDSVILEREEGDGQESIPSKKVDDDEDKKNPQYIPKRGTFYEHDDRTLDEEEKEEVLDKNDKQNKKNVWMEKKERWGHDRFNDNEQAPKSRSELIAIYGYDIRNEDGPPKARRRRRYGRGPNKYTRNWEDEDAYRPLKPVKPVKKTRNDKEEYPPLVSSPEVEIKTDTNSSENLNEPESSIQPDIKFKPVAEVLPPREPVAEKSHQRYGPPDKGLTLHRVPQPRVGTGRIVKPKAEPKPEVKDSDYKGFTKTRQFRNSKSEQKVYPKPPAREEKPSLVQMRNSKLNLEKDMAKLSVQDSGGRSNSKQNTQRQASVPPRLQGEQKGSKRYSSIRQRSLPETPAPPFTQANSYYASEYQQSQSPPMMTTPTPIRGSGTQVSQIAPPPMQPLPQQVPVTATPIAQYPAPFPQAPPTFLPPNVPTPPFIPQPAPPPIINYVQSQPPPPIIAQPSFPSYQHQQFNTVNPTGELYQFQGGTTYYSTQNQHLAQRAAPPKRPKAAIPILPPPPQEPRGRGRLGKERETPSPDYAIMHNIENMNDYEDATVALEL